jgi:energy-coupling factor transporter ATP-binding protein EcfA2
MDSFHLSVLDRGIVIHSDGEKAQRVIALIYDSLRGGGAHLNLRYSVTQRKGSCGFTLRRNSQESITAPNDGELAFLLKNDMTIEVQKLRPDLYFIHAASLQFEKRAILLVGPSGSGKSTTTWGLLHFGFRYLSDELAPVRLDTMEVNPYPLAICLKKKPPKPYFLPNQTLFTSRTIHVPTEFLPSKVRQDPIPLVAIFFLHRPSPCSAAAVKPMGKAEAAARLFANALNPLVHEGEGLDGAIKIVRNRPCFELTIADLSATCALVKNTLRRISDDQITGY